MKKNTGALATLLLLIAMSISACSTIVSGKAQSVTFQSTPPGATVTISGVVIGVTPFTTMIEKKSGQTISVEKEGYKTYTAPMETSIDPWFFGNILIGGLLGSTTDGATGAMHRYAPSQFMILLEQEGSTSADATTGKSKKDKAREFIILSYNQIMVDISNGSGNYESSLMNLLEIPDSEQSAAIIRIKSLSESFPDIAQFADQVTTAYIK